MKTIILSQNCISSSSSDLIFLSMYFAGHGKFETLGALGISGMLIVTAGGIAWHAADILLVWPTSLFPTNSNTPIKCVYFA